MQDKTQAPHPQIVLTAIDLNTPTIAYGPTGAVYGVTYRDSDGTAVYLTKAHYEALERVLGAAIKTEGLKTQAPVGQTG